ncbi:MAG TPA: hypothetical protein VHM90_09715, partial [Phycisphaerae bacterium]|nr:hypothetical protein [Phycisphaerae bacterium]
MIHKCRIRKTLALLVWASAASAHGAQIVSTWLGGAGNWNDPTKWSGGVVPSNAANSYLVNIDGASPTASVVTWNASPANLPAISLDALTIDANDKLI